MLYFGIWHSILKAASSGWTLLANSLLIGLLIYSVPTTQRSRAELFDVD
jgi:hypothetical protein